MKKIRASFTIEATVVLTLVLCVVVGIVYVALLFHDRLITKFANYEVSSSVQEDKIKQQQINDILAQRMILKGNIYAGVSNGGKVYSYIAKTLPIVWLKNIIPETLLVYRVEYKKKELDYEDKIRSYKVLFDTKEDIFSED